MNSPNSPFSLISTTLRVQLEPEGAMCCSGSLKGPGAAEVICAKRITAPMVTDGAPLSPEQVEEIRDEEGYATALVAVGLSDLIRVASLWRRPGDDDHYGHLHRIVFGVGVPHDPTIEVIGAGEGDDEVIVAYRSYIPVED